jgi:hypothetical protein
MNTTQPAARLDAIIARASLNLPVCDSCGRPVRRASGIVADSKVTVRLTDEGAQFTIEAIDGTITLAGSRDEALVAA